MYLYRLELVPSISRGFLGHIIMPIDQTAYFKAYVRRLTDRNDTSVGENDEKKQGELGTPHSEQERSELTFKLTL